jgi:hypothetical protein
MCDRFVTRSAGWIRLSRDSGLLIARPFVGIVALIWSTAERQVWPPIVPMVREVRFVDIQSGTDTPAKLTIDSLSATPLYLIECHNGEYEADRPMNFSGDFHCGVFALSDSGQLSSGNLLAESTRAARGSDWFNRGRFLARELQELGVPNFGASRSFRFRGLKVDIDLKDMQWRVASKGHQALRQFTARFSVTPDPQATSATAERLAEQPPVACRSD